MKIDINYKFFIKVAYYHNGKRLKNTGNTNDFEDLIKYFSQTKYKDWIFINVFYQYKDANGWRYGQITSFVNRHQPSSKEPTAADIRRFVQMMERANTSGLRSSDRRAVIRYCKDVLSVPTSAVGLSATKKAGSYGDTQQTGRHGIYRPQSE